MSVIIRLQGLPWTASAMNIRHFFSGLSIPAGGVHIIGGDGGDAFIAFSSDDDARMAMKKNMCCLNDTPIQLFLSSKAEMQSVIDAARSGVSSQAVSSAQQTAPMMTADAPPVMAGVQVGMQGQNFPPNMAMAGVDGHMKPNVQPIPGSGNDLRSQMQQSQWQGFQGGMEAGDGANQPRQHQMMGQQHGKGGFPDGGDYQLPKVGDHQMGNRGFNNQGRDGGSTMLDQQSQDMAHGSMMRGPVNTYNQGQRGGHMNQSPMEAQMNQGIISQRPPNQQGQIGFGNMGQPGNQDFTNHYQMGVPRPMGVNQGDKHGPVQANMPGRLPLRHDTPMGQSGPSPMIGRQETGGDGFPPVMNRHNFSDNRGPESRMGFNMPPVSMPGSNHPGNQFSGDAAAIHGIDKGRNMPWAGNTIQGPQMDKNQFSQDMNLDRAKEDFRNPNNLNPQDASNRSFLGPGTMYGSNRRPGMHSEQFLDKMEEDSLPSTSYPPDEPSMDSESDPRMQNRFPPMHGDHKLGASNFPRPDRFMGKGMEMDQENFFEHNRRFGLENRPDRKLPSDGNNLPPNTAEQMGSYGLSDNRLPPNVRGTLDDQYFGRRPNDSSFQPGDNGYSRDKDVFERDRPDGPWQRQLGPGRNVENRDQFQPALRPGDRRDFRNATDTESSLGNLREPGRRGPSRWDTAKGDVVPEPATPSNSALENTSNKSERNASDETVIDKDQRKGSVERGKIDSLTKANVMDKPNVAGEKSMATGVGLTLRASSLGKVDPVLEERSSMERKAETLEGQGTRFDELRPGLGNRGSGFEERAPGFAGRGIGMETRRPGFQENASGFEEGRQGFEGRRPGFDFHGPEFDARDSGLGQRGPGFEGRDPGLGQRGPGFEQRDQGHGQRGPGFEGRGPGFEGRGPGFDGRGPGFEVRGPGFEGRGPGFEGRGPGFEGRGPGFEGRGSGFEGRGPGFEGKGPGFEGRGPGFEGRGPVFEGRGPGFEGRGPRFERGGPEMEGLEFEERGLEFEGRGRRFEERGLRLEGRGPGVDGFEGREPGFERRDPGFERRGPGFEGRGRGFEGRGRGFEGRGRGFERRRPDFEGRRGEMSFDNRRRDFERFEDMDVEGREEAELDSQGRHELERRMYLEGRHGRYGIDEKVDMMGPPFEGRGSRFDGQGPNFEERRGPTFDGMHELDVDRRQNPDFDGREPEIDRSRVAGYGRGGPGTRGRGSDVMRGRVGTMAEMPRSRGFSDKPFDRDLPLLATPGTNEMEDFDNRIPGRGGPMFDRPFRGRGDPFFRGRGGPPGPFGRGRGMETDRFEEGGPKDVDARNMGGPSNVPSDPQQFKGASRDASPNRSANVEKGASKEDDSADRRRDQRSESASRRDVDSRDYRRSYDRDREYDRDRRYDDRRGRGRDERRYEDRSRYRYSRDRHRRSRSRSRDRSRDRDRYSSAGKTGSPRRSETQGRSVCVKNMPLTANYREVRRFFQPFDIPFDGLKIINDEKGNRKGVAYVQFRRSGDVQEALRKSGQKMDSKTVSVTSCTDEEFSKAVDSYVPPLTKSTTDVSEIKLPPSQAKEKPPNPDKVRYILQLKNLPLSITKQNILQFFQGVIIDNNGQSAYIEFDNSGVATGNGFVEMKSDMDYKKGLTYDGSKIGDNAIRVLPGKPEEADDLKGKQLEMLQRAALRNASGSKGIGPGAQVTRPGAMGPRPDVPFQQTKPQPQMPNPNQVRPQGPPQVRPQGPPQVKPQGPPQAADPVTTPKPQAQSQNQQKQPQQPPQVSSPVKTAPQEDEKKILDTVCVHIQGLPLLATPQDIRQFFNESQIALRGINIAHDSRGKPLGEGFVEFRTRADFDKALKKDKTSLGRHIVAVKPISKKEMLERLGTSHKASEHSSSKTDEAKKDNNGGQGLLATPIATNQNKQEDLSQTALSSAPGSLQSPNGGQQQRLAQPGLLGDPPSPAHGGPQPQSGVPLQRMPPPQQQRPKPLMSGHVPPGPEMPPAPVNKGIPPGVLNQNWFYVRCQNFPPDISISEILHFFQGFRPLGHSIRLHYSSDGKPTGNAVVGFAHREEAERALGSLNTKRCRQNIITLYPA
ncbi:RNA-binding protein 12B [Elysia marginata]|uniref:RNA-binding protein 12B n=1 Tax=Elysia marginata TaxID=1093978 RepID=A0AAV4FAL9_9GAST|nr:RNA-binding protein 12B [Elysia marginata]